MNNILITSGGRRVSLVRSFKKELKKIIPDGKVYVADVNPGLSSAAQISDESFSICKIQDELYVSNLLKLSKKHGVKVIIPTLDTELSVLSENIVKFKEQGIELVLSSRELIGLCDDKLKTQDLFTSVGIEVATVYNKTNYLLPLFIKPTNGSNSKDTQIIKSDDQISKYHLENKDLHFFEYFDHSLYHEYTCDLYYDKNSVLKCVVPRKRIEVRCGEINKGVTCKNKIKELIEINFKTLKGARGPITIQFFMNQDGNVKGIEINPRFGGGFPLSYMAGGNFPKWIVQEYILGREVSYFDDWEDNLLMLRYDDEILIHDYEG